MDEMYCSVRRRAVYLLQMPSELAPSTVSLSFAILNYIVEFIPGGNDSSYSIHFLVRNPPVVLLHVCIRDM